MDGSCISTADGQPTLCAYWKPRHGSSNEYGFSRGIAHHILGLKQVGGDYTVAIAVTSYPYLDTEAIHYVSNLDVFGPIYSDQDHIRLLTILHQEDRSHRSPPTSAAETPDEPQLTP
jgi:hypothetical protein